MIRRDRVPNRPTPVRGICVVLAAMAVAMLAVASRIEQPPLQVPAAGISMNVAASD